MPEKIRIAYLIDTFSTDLAGTEKQLLEIIRRLDPLRFEVLLVSLKPSPWLATHPLPCRHVVLRYRGLLKPDFPAIVRKVAALLEEERIDILQTFFEESVFVAFCCRFGRRPFPRIFLASKRDMGLGAGSPWYTPLFRTAWPAAALAFDRIVVNGNGLRDYLARGRRIAPGRIAVIRNGVELPAATAGGVPPRVPGGQIRIGIVANLKPVKRVDVFLRALGQLRQWNAFPFQALILGDGPERGRLTRLAADLGVSSHIHFAGSVPSVAPHLQNLDIAVLCSDREGLSNAILEYMANGLPVVATDAGCNAELVDGRNGVLVPRGDPRPLAEALREIGVSAELRRTLGEGSLARIREEFTWERIMPQWEGFYSSLMQAKDVARARLAAGGGAHPLGGKR